MGYITTFSIYNDGIENIKENPVEFANSSYECVVNHVGNQPTSIQLGNFSNLIRVQPTRHADDATIYIHSGNCVTEFNAYNIAWKTGFFKSAFNRKLLKTLIEDTNKILETLSSEDFYNLLIEGTTVIPEEKLPDEYHNKLLAKSFTNEINDSIKRYLQRFGTQNV